MIACRSVSPIAAHRAISLSVRPQPPEHREATRPGQAEVEKNEIWVRRRRKGQRLRGSGGYRQRPEPRMTVDQLYVHGRDLGVILDDQDGVFTHRAP